jgi:hypothetical protein
MPKHSLLKIIIKHDIRIMMMEMYFTLSAESVPRETEGNQKNLSWATFKRGDGYCVVL